MIPSIRQQYNQDFSATCGCHNASLETFRPPFFVVAAAADGFAFEVVGEGFEVDGFLFGEGGVVAQRRVELGAREGGVVQVLDGLAADEKGYVYVTGKTACCIENRDKLTVNGQPVALDESGRATITAGAAGLTTSSS